MAESTTDAQALSSEDWFVADSFGFGVEREMKESGEKGGTEAASADTSGPQAAFVIQFDRPVDPSPRRATWSVRTTSRAGKTTYGHTAGDIGRRGRPIDH